MKNIRIKTAGTGLSVLMVVVAVAVFSTFLITFNNMRHMAATWQGFEEGAAAKVDLVADLRAALGYGGVIHEFKNFVLRKDRLRIVDIQSKMLDVSVALTAYSSLGMNDQEKTAVREISATLDKYIDAVAKAEKMAAQGATSHAIDKAVRIDDTAALNALAVLDNELLAFREASAESVYRSVARVTGIITMAGIMVGVLFVILITGFFWFTRERLVGPLMALGGAMEDLAADDVEIDIPFLDGRDELGDMARTVEVFKENLVLRKQAELELKKTKYQLELRVEKRTEELTTVKNRLEKILDNATSGVITIDENGAIQSFNREAENIFGYSADEAIDRNVKMLMPPSYAGKHDSFLANYLRTGEAKIIGFGREVTGLRKDGSEFSMELGISELQLSGKRLFTGLVTDITHRKEAEEALVAARDEADRANQAKSEFLSSMSHELRTPLNAILGFAQLLEHDPKKPLTKEQRESVQQILIGGEHLLTLIDDVLNLAQIESGQFSLSIEVTDLEPVFGECLAIARTLAEKRGITVIDRTRDQDIPWALIDATRFQQVLLNLLSNAVKYNRDEGSVILKADETADGRVRVSVTDTGPGIPRDKQDQLFQPFSRLGLEATDIQGTGIGLSITKKLVEMMDGRIGFESAPGKGSTFWVEVPLAEDGEKTKRKDKRSSPSQGAEAQLKPGHTLLYVEDNPANLKLMETLIERVPDMHMLSAHTGELGLELAAAHRPDVILMDINLPGIDGVEALKRLKESPETRDIPVIALTANAMPRDVEAGLKAGFHRYLTKPIRIDEITSALESALEGGNPTVH